jgi:hypothetical protein
MAGETAIEIRFRVRYEDHGFPSLHFEFTQWFPLGEDDAIKCTEDGISVQIHFDQKCIGNLQLEEVSQIPNYMNINTRAVLVTCQTDVSNDLLKYMKDKDYRKFYDPAMDNLESDYLKMAEKVLAAGVKRVNRLFSYVNNVHGFFACIPINATSGDIPSAMVRYNAHFRICGNAEWMRFGPQKGRAIPARIHMPMRYVSKNDWSQIRDFVSGDEKMPNYKEIISAAKMLASAGFLRSAVTEAVAALEQCTKSFGARCGNGSAAPESVVDGVNVADHIERLGFTCSFDVLLPLVLKPGVIQPGDHSLAKEAILIRHNIVHNLQRALNVTKVVKQITSIEKICDILHNIK